MDDGAVDAFGGGAAVAFVARLGTGLFLAGFARRLGIRGNDARRRVRAGRGARDGGGKLEQEESDDERIAVEEEVGLGFGEGAGAERGEEGRFEGGGRGWRDECHGSIGLSNRCPMRKPNFNRLMGYHFGTPFK